LEKVVDIKSEIHQIEKLRIVHYTKLFQAKLAAADDLQRRKLLSKEEAKKMAATIERLVTYIHEHE